MRAMRDPYNRIGEDELIYQVFRMHDRLLFGSNKGRKRCEPDDR